MCGICFGIRLSASYVAAGASPPPDSTSGDCPSPDISSPNSCFDGLTNRPDFGIPLPEGGKPAVYLDANETWQVLVDAVRSRGPDSSTTLIKHVKAKRQFHFEMRFHASVLHMRGTDVTPQPFTADNGDVLLFNGEIFDGLEISPDENDGRKLFDLIQREGPSNFFAAIRNIEGPYAFVYYQASDQRIYFARDSLGRRSLLMHRPTPISPFLFLGSNGPSIDFPLNEWEEVSCDAVHCYHLLNLKGKSWLVDGKRGLSSYPRYPKSMGLSTDILIYPFDRLNPTLPLPHNLLSGVTNGLPILTAPLHLTIQNLLKELELALRKRVLSAPFFPPAPAARIAVLFSGGIDCTTLALLLDRVLPRGEAVDLINVGFENPRSLRGQFNLPPGTNKKSKGKGKARDQDLINVDAGTASAAMSPRCEEEERKPVLPEVPMEVENEEPVLLHEDPTPLATPMPMNEDPPVLLPPDPAIFEVPDRLTGRASLEELRRLRPDRKWNFVEVNVGYQEMLAERPKVIELMRPNQTVMDLSIAIAFFFAARGRGVVQDPSGSGPATPYESKARVLLSGLGADELLGGYARHRRAFYMKPEGDWAALIKELQMDIDRLGSRNLGRDDRIISYHGKEARYPFLAGHVVDFCSRTPIWMKVDMRFDEGVGDKMILRLLAKELGLSGAATLKKRAIHFGARTAKMELGSGHAKGDALLE